MPLSWNEIKDRALRFSREWADESSEDAEAKSFWDGFFNVFGVSRRRIATFEKRVKTIDGSSGYIDLLWKGVLLVEHKSRGRNLERAHDQARSYFHGLKDSELPKYLLVSDFARFRLYDLEAGDESFEFPLKDLHKHVKRFGFIAGYQARPFKEEDPVNVRAAERMGNLHDALEAAGYKGHNLEVLLVRLLFCLFADDTGIFPRNAFHELIVQRSSPDGADLGLWLGQLFQVLDTDIPDRQQTLDSQLAEFPYVNGKLFAEKLSLAAFNAKMRDLLVEASSLDWSRISPAIFGSMFQSVMDTKARRNLGAHYTSEANILKLLGPLCLDELRDEFQKVSDNPAKLKAFHGKLATLSFMDPACGCGNFLVIAYRELRQLELDVISRQFEHTESVLAGVAAHVFVDVDQFYGIEVEEFPAQIAQVAMWLMDHQMNLRVAERFGEYFVRLPLAKSPTIVHGDALELDWTAVAPKNLTYIMGNPPFIGSKLMTAGQREGLLRTAPGVRSAGLLDFVCAWYLKASEFIGKGVTRAAFVSTNSVSQGEQVGVLWGELYRRGMEIQFAHRTFQWKNEAKGVAAVHCVIVGFSSPNTKSKRLFDYEHLKAEPHEVEASNINPYLVDGPSVVLENRTFPICAAPAIGIGNKPIDGGHYLFSGDEKAAFLHEEPRAEKYFRRWLGSDEFLNGWERWCLWLGDCPPDQLREMPQVMRRVEAVRAFRMASKSEPTRRLANTPTRFHVENMPTSEYLVIPEVSSERRAYIPIGYLDPETLSSNLLKVVKNASIFDFGILQSRMHMAWTRYVCGRLKSDYRYSSGIVYNNFPWPDAATGQQRAKISAMASNILAERKKFPNSSLADLYDSASMPSELWRAHQKLDAAVDVLYAKRREFRSDSDRVAFLFERYRTLTSLPLRAKKARAAKV